MRKNILKIYGVVISGGLIYYIFTLLTGVSIPCIYYIMTGIKCPGCGITRMFKALLRLDFCEAFFHNPVVFVLLIIWNVIAVLLFLGKPEFLRKPRFLYSAFVLTLAVLLIYAVLRNLT